MAKKVSKKQKPIDIAYSVEETAKLFSCLSPEIQDEILSVMREMVKANKAAQASEQFAANTVGSAAR